MERARDRGVKIKVRYRITSSLPLSKLENKPRTISNNRKRYKSDERLRIGPSLYTALVLYIGVELLSSGSYCIANRLPAFIKDFVYGLHR